MTEKEFMRAVVDAAELAGWYVYHTYDSRRSSPGFPDLVLVRGRELVFAELKTEKGRVSAPQRAWLEALAQVREVSSYVWRPTDWQELERVIFGRR